MFLGILPVFPGFQIFNLSMPSMFSRKTCNIMFAQVQHLKCHRLVLISGWSVYQTSQFSSNIHISLHNWASKYICSIRYNVYLYPFWGSAGHICIQDLKTAPEVGRQRRPTSSAVVFVFRTDVSWTSKIKERISIISKGTYWFQDLIE